MADKDFLVLDADEAEFLRRFPGARRVGRQFPVWIAGGDEYAFLRAADLERDLAGRDLTVNALALDEDGELYCHPQALEDLRDRVLRPASPTALADDPVRVYRAARFAAVLPGFTPHPDLLAQMSALAHSQALSDLAPERVGQEAVKALAAPLPSAFLRLLARTDCLDPWLPELDSARVVPAGPGRHGGDTVFEHTCAVLDRLPPDPLTRWMGLCHDLGKTTTPGDQWPAHHGHAARGVEPARLAARRLRLTNRYTLAGCLAAELHMLAGDYDQLRPGTRVDLLTRLAAADLARELFAVVLADKGADHWPEARADLERILAMHLPAEDCDDGPLSGEKLRRLRAEGLARDRRLPL
ncbi:MAG: tRNA nucleotidyltransferase [Desulfovibrionaceae bacterium]